MLRPQLLFTLLLLGWCMEAQASQHRDVRAAVRTNVKKWENTYVPFVLDPGYSDNEKSTIRDAIKTINDNTCINFEENGQGLKLEYFHADSTQSCSSDLGDRRTTENQKMTMASYCLDTPTILHETLHALGFDHTQVRTDRDQYIQVFDDNIKPDWKREFNKLADSQSTTNYSIPYEYNSVMHYGSFVLKQASIDLSQPVIVPLDKDYITAMGRDHGLTFNDIKMINLHYNCIESCSDPITCQNSGYPHPRHCDQCVCPMFYDGATCEQERNPYVLKMGETKPLDYAFEWNETAIKIDPLPPYQQFPRSPVRIIKAPEGTRINITVLHIDDRILQQSGRCRDACDEKGLEIVIGDLTSVGKRFCCHKNLPHWFLSNTNVIGYQVYARPGLDFVANVTFTVVGTPTSPDAETIKPDEPHTAVPTVAAPPTTMPSQGNDNDLTTTVAHQDTLTTDENPFEQPNVDPHMQTTLSSQVNEQTTPATHPEPPVTDAPPAPATSQPNPVEPSNPSVPEGAKEVGTVTVGGISTVITEGPSLKERGEVPAVWADTKEAQFSIRVKCTMIVNFIKRADGEDYPSNQTIRNNRDRVYNIPFRDIQAIADVRGSCK